MNCVLGYEPVPDEESPERVWVDAPGLHSVSCAYKEELLAAMQDLQPRDGARLVLFGTEVAEVSDAERQRLQRRVGFVPANGGLMSTLNAWENISLQAAYHGKPPLAEVAAITHEVLAAFGIEPRGFLNRVPDELGKLERKIAAFARLMVAGPELALIESLDEGLSRAECARVAGFEQEYRRRHPAGTLVFVDIREEES